MERSGPVLVLCIGIGTCFNQAPNGRGLRPRIPPWRIRSSDRRQMQWLCAPAVLRPHFRARLDEFAGHLRPIRSRCEMQSRVAGVDVVADLYKKVGAGARYPFRVAPPWNVAVASAGEAPIIFENNALWLATIASTSLRRA